MKKIIDLLLLGLLACTFFKIYKAQDEFISDCVELDGIEFIWVDQDLIVDQAELACTTLDPNAELAVIPSEDSFNALSSFLVEVIPADDLSSKQPWIGLRRQLDITFPPGTEFTEPNVFTSEGFFGTDVENGAFPWRTGRPDNNNGDEVCIFMDFISGIGSHLWNDFLCDFPATFVCSRQCSEEVTISPTSKPTKSPSRKPTNSPTFSSPVVTPAPVDSTNRPSTNEPAATESPSVLDVIENENSEEGSEFEVVGIIIGALCLFMMLLLLGAFFHQRMSLNKRKQKLKILNEGLENLSLNI